MFFLPLLSPPESTLPTTVEHKAGLLDERGRALPALRLRSSAARPLVPTLHVCYQRDAHTSQVERLFDSEARTVFSVTSQVDVCCTFDYGDVAVAQVDVFLATDTLANLAPARLAAPAVRVIAAAFHGKPIFIEVTELAHTLRVSPRGGT